MEVTASSIKTYQTCQRKYWYSYELLLKLKEERQYLSDGRYIHSFLSRYYTNKSFEGVLLPEINSANSAMLCGLLEGYAKIYKPDEFNLYIPEKKFEMKFGEDVLMGVRDAVVRDLSGNLFFLEYKSTKGSLTKLSEQLGTDIQNLIYFLATYLEIGEIPTGIIYRCLKKSSLRLRKSESEEEFYNRIRRDYFERPEAYFYQFKLYKSYTDIAWLRQEISQLLCEMKVKKEIWVRNLQRCHDFGGCEFIPLCQKQELDDGLLKNFYDRKESKHEEIVSS